MKGVVMMALAAAVALSGCAPSGREPDNLALVRVMGVDGAGPVTLTGVCGGANQQDVSRGTSQGETFGLARDRLPWSSTEELALTSVGYLLIGRDADLTAVLFAVLEDQDLGASATVWLAQDGALAELESCQDPATDLELLLRQGVRVPTAAQALAALCTEGQAVLPVVTAREGRLEIRGEEVWKTNR
ncbi:MAG TPA: hypothetical protein IAC25_09205 [Candidatus Enterenecus stercoripullorum]|nr:hypothetical protein [Candidatus Enterenecus stercoripullorum]